MNTFQENVTMKRYNLFLKSQMAVGLFNKFKDVMRYGASPQEFIWMIRSQINGDQHNLRASVAQGGPTTW